MFFTPEFIFINLISGVPREQSWGFCAPPGLSGLKDCRRGGGWSAVVKAGASARSVFMCIIHVLEMPSGSLQSALESRCDYSHVAGNDLESQRG